MAQRRRRSRRSVRSAQWERASRLPTESRASRQCTPVLYPIAPQAAADQLSRAAVCTGGGSLNAAADLVSVRTTRLSRELKPPGFKDSPRKLLATRAPDARSCTPQSTAKSKRHEGRRRVRALFVASSEAPSTLDRAGACNLPARHRVSIASQQSDLVNLSIVSGGGARRYPRRRARPDMCNCSSTVGR